MNIHEYQAKELYRKYGIPVPKGIPGDFAQVYGWFVPVLDANDRPYPG